MWDDDFDPDDSSDLDDAMEEWYDSWDSTDPDVEGPLGNL